jgi:hypothetical protein
MVYTEQLPKIKNLQLLANKVTGFPISRLGIVQQAEHLGYDEQIIDFLRLFSEQLVFNSRTDFLEHCRLLERLLKEERDSIPESLISSEGWG